MFWKTILFLSIASFLSVNAQTTNTTTFDCNSKEGEQCSGLAESAGRFLEANPPIDIAIFASCQRLDNENCTFFEYEACSTFNMTSIYQQCNLTIPEPPTITATNPPLPPLNPTIPAGPSTTTSEAPSTTTPSFPPTLPAIVDSLCLENLQKLGKDNYINSLLSLTTDPRITLDYRCHWLQERSLIKSAYEDVRDNCGQGQFVNLLNFITSARKAFGCKKLV